jgi:hypothetical protein
MGLRRLALDPWAEESVDSLGGVGRAVHMGGELGRASYEARAVSVQG